MKGGIKQETVAPRRILDRGARPSGFLTHQLLSPVSWHFLQIPNLSFIALWSCWDTTGMFKQEWLRSQGNKRKKKQNNTNTGKMAWGHSLFDGAFKSFPPTLQTPENVEPFFLSFGSNIFIHLCLYFFNKYLLSSYDMAGSETIA